MAVDLSRVVSCNMYRSVGAMWEGLVRSLYSVAAVSRLALVPLFAIGYFFFLLPFYSLWSVLVAAAVPVDVRALVFFQVAAMLVMRGLVDNRFREPIISAFVHPFGFSFLFLAALYAGGLRLIGASVRWKRRVYSPESCVDESAALGERQ